MKKICLTKTSYLSIFFISLILFTCNAIANTKKVDNWLDEPINISFHNEALSKVLKQISEQTGVSIAYDQELANKKVTGNYQNVKTSDAITRLFKSSNISIQVNTEKKIIIVKTFGAKNFIWAGVVQGQDKPSQMTLSELEKMHALQYKEFKERISNDNEILEGGMTRGEIKAMHKDSHQLLQTRVTDKSEVLEGDKTRGEIQAAHKEQYKKYQILISDKNTILEGGMTRGEVLVAHQKQHDENVDRLTNKNAILEGGMTRTEVREMHKQQAKDYQINLNEKPISMD